MSLLTEQEIEDLYYMELDRRELSFARAIEAKVIDKIKEQGATIWSCDVLQSDATFKSELSTIEPPTNYYSIRNVKAYYHLPEGD